MFKLSIDGEKLDLGWLGQGQTGHSHFQWAYISTMVTDTDIENHAWVLGGLWESMRALTGLRQLWATAQT